VRRPGTPEASTKAGPSASKPKTPEMTHTFGRPNTY